MSEVTIKEWISIMERSGLVYILKPYTSSALNRAIRTPKLYFRDTGLCSYLTRWLTPESLREELNVPSGERHELCRALHAEQNAIIQAAVLGQSVDGGSIYITHQPCAICSKMIINAGISRIVVREGYPDDLARDILDEAGLKVVTLDKLAKNK